VTGLANQLWLERPPPKHAGWKDTVDAQPGQVTRVLARFDIYREKYVLHYHKLKYSDKRT
jgi:spore coat protein A